ELLECQAGRLATDRVEPRQDHCLRRVVDDHVDAGRLLERADVATLATDDPPLHLVRRKADDGHRALRGVVCRDALDRERDDVASLSLGVPLRVLLDLADHVRCAGAGLLLQPLHEPLDRFLRAHAGERLQARAGLLLQPRRCLVARLQLGRPRVQRALPLRQLALLRIQQVVLPVERTATLLDPLLGPLEVLAPPRLLALPLLARAVRLLSALELGLALETLRLRAGLLPDARRDGFRIRSMPFQSTALEPPAGEHAHEGGADGKRAEQQRRIHDHSRKAAVGRRGRRRLTGYDSGGCGWSTALRRALPRKVVATRAPPQGGAAAPAGLLPLRGNGIRRREPGADVGRPAGRGADDLRDQRLRLASRLEELVGQ